VLRVALLQNSKNRYYQVTINFSYCKYDHLDLRPPALQIEAVMKCSTENLKLWSNFNVKTKLRSDNNVTYLLNVPSRVQFCTLVFGLHNN